jgi:FKBP-type peptidyl-prolyl cis-trans isomerase SlyD
MNYTLTDDEGQVIDESQVPMDYLHGYENIIPGLEKELEGTEPGDKRDVVVDPAEGYGEHDPEAVFAVPADRVPDHKQLTPGMNVVADTPDGPMPLVVLEVNDDNVVVDANHPLAGKRLHFAVEIVDVRAATGDELAQGCVL